MIYLLLPLVVIVLPAIGASILINKVLKEEEPEGSEEDKNNV